MREGKNATMVLHDPGGRQSWPVSRFKVSAVEQFRQLGPIVYIDVKGQGQKDRPWWTRATNSIARSSVPARCFTNSRNDLAVDMRKFDAAARRELKRLKRPRRPSIGQRRADVAPCKPRL